MYEARLQARKNQENYLRSTGSNGLLGCSSQRKSDLQLACQHKDIDFGHKEPTSFF